MVLPLIAPSLLGVAFFGVTLSYDDTGLEEVRRMAAYPVIGIGHSSFVMASLIAESAVVITTLEAAVPVITANIERHGLTSRIAKVVAAQVPVLDLEAAPDRAAAEFIEAARALSPEPPLIILGCAGGSRSGAMWPASCAAR